MTPRLLRLELSAVAIALLLSMAIGSALMLIVGASPGRVWWEMIATTATDPTTFGQMLYKATGLTLTGLSVAIALDAGLFNIGAEGQMTAGVLACAVTGLALPVGTPAVLAIPLCVLAGAAAGAAIGALIGVLRVTRGAHEVITSIMLNVIISGVALYIGNLALFSNGTTTSGPIAPGAELARLGLGNSAANAGIVLAIAAAGAIWWLRSRTTWGQAWRAVGESPEAARTTGTPVGKVQIAVMTGAGALAGIAAANFVLGGKHAFEEGLGRGTGLLGLAAAVLGRMHPVGIVLASLLLGFLTAGGLTGNERVPKELPEMLQGVVMLSVAVSAVWVRRRAAAQEAPAP